MALHPQIVKGLEALAKANLPPLHTLSAPEARAQMAAMNAARGGEPTPVRKLENRTIPGPAGDIPIRIYWPHVEGMRGALVYYHGGGHVIGSLDTHDKVARNLCEGAACVVVSVDYRMGPEHRFPAAVEDSWAALLWTVDNAKVLNIDPDRIAVGGDSAGGNLAGVMALMARNAGTPKLVLQSLVYPVGDYHLTGESYQTYAEGFGILTAKAMKWFQEHYLNSVEDAKDWRASPLLAKSLADTAPAIITAAECDVLYDDGVRYRDALQAAGVSVKYTCYPGTIHAFFGMAPDVDPAIEAQKDVAAALRSAFNK
jgi:acetyl esterase